VAIGDTPHDARDPQHAARYRTQQEEYYRFFKKGSVPAHSGSGEAGEAPQGNFNVWPHKRLTWPFFFVPVRNEAEKRHNPPSPCPPGDPPKESRHTEHSYALPALSGTGPQWRRQRRAWRSSCSVLGLVGVLDDCLPWYLFFLGLAQVPLWRCKAARAFVLDDEWVMGDCEGSGAHNPTLHGTRLECTYHVCTRSAQDLVEQEGRHGERVGEGYKAALHHPLRGTGLPIHTSLTQATRTQPGVLDAAPNTKHL
jgi:hypothetical protein